MPKKTPKWIFFDLDGTVIDHTTHTVPQKTRKALELLRENGHHLVMATGRSPALLGDVLRDLNIETFIAVNGRYVCHKGEVLYENNIPASLVKELSDDLRQRGIDVAYLSAHQYAIAEKNTDLPKRFSEYFNLPEPTTVPNFHLQNNVLQMVMFNESDDYENIASKYPALEFIASCPYGVDINHRGGMKETGMKVLAKHLGFLREHTVAIGDGFNDISLIREAGIGIAMGNACKPLKEASDIVTSRVEDNGFYEAFVKLNML